MNKILETLTALPDWVYIGAAGACTGLALYFLYKCLMATPTTKVLYNALLTLIFAIAAMVALNKLGLLP